MKIKQAKLSGAGVYLGALATVTTVAASALVIPNVAADNSSADHVQINVQSSCTLSGTNGHYNVDIINGTKNENIGNSVIAAYCNDGNGFGIYAVGASNDVEGDTYMHHDSNSAYDFNTGTTFSGDTSAWAMKITPTTNKYTPQVSTGFDSFHVIPNQYTMVAYRDDTQGGSDDIDTPSAVGSEITATYGIYVSSYQQPGTYTGKVRYALVHPYSNTNLVSLQKALSDATAPTKTVGGKTYFTMQGMTSNICANANIVGTASRLKMVDSRDDHIYYVAKLADNKCWLLDNLALDLTNSTILNGLDANNTNADATTLGYLKGTTTRDPATNPDGNYATAGVANWTSGYSYSAPLVNMASKDLTRADLTNPSDPLTEADDWKFGGYYNYCAASAGSYCYGNGTNKGTPSGNATADICPSGWRMPTGGADGEYQALATIINGASGNITDSTKHTAFRNALSLPLSGGFDDGSAFYQGSNGYFWSSTYGGSRTMYDLSVNASSVYPQSGDGRSVGGSVRCVAQ